LRGVLTLKIQESPWNKDCGAVATGKECLEHSKTAGFFAEIPPAVLLTQHRSTTPPNTTVMTGVIVIAKKNK
jgi:hypothetical protein